MFYYVETARYNDGKYVNLLEQLFGEKPKFVETDGMYTAYYLKTEPVTFDQKWAVGSTEDEMLKKGLIIRDNTEGYGLEDKMLREGLVEEYGLAVRPAALKDPSIIDKRPIEWDDLTDDAKNLLSR